MVDMLFVEIGAVVTEILGPSRCTIAPYSGLEGPPAYGAEGHVEVDFELSLDEVLRNRAWLLSVEVTALRAVVDRTDDLGSAAIGPTWPGGVYEGVVSFRQDVLQTNATLAAAAAALPGSPWEYQIVASIDEDTGQVRSRYQGFHAEIVEDLRGGVLVLQVVNAGRSAEPSSPRMTVRYDPADTKTFYAGPLVAKDLVRGGPEPRKSGAVFIALEAVQRFALAVPKLPVSAGD